MSKYIGFQIRDPNNKASVDIRKNKTIDVRGQILTALRNVNYKVRTVNGIATEVGVSNDAIQDLLTKDSLLAESVKLMPFKSKDGQYLYMDRTRYSKETSLSEKFVDLFATIRAGDK